MTYTDASGKTRHKAQHLVSFGSAPANTADLDDSVAADATSTISISAQPADVTGAADPVTDTFSVTATASSGSVVYQWQVQTATATTRWTNISDAGIYSGSVTDTLTITAADKATYDGYKFRVKLTSTAGADEVISGTATLTFA